MLGKFIAAAATTTTTCTTGRRMFSRADIVKGLDRSKVNRRAFIKKELKENPDFFKAFPHMQKTLNYRKPGEESATRRQGGDSSSKDNKLVDEPKYFEDKRVAFKEAGETNPPFFESLLHHQNQYLAPQDKEEAIRENEKNFVEGYLSPSGPMKWLNEKELEQIHVEIDERMQELEDSGLTREEILYDEQVGERFLIFVRRKAYHSQMTPSSSS
jgi:hypothetical protein